MSTVSKQPYPSRQAPELPWYFRKDSRERNAFLSEIGHFNETHRALFNSVCDLYEPDLSYEKFLKHARENTFNSEGLLADLMHHLKQANCGLIACRCVGGELQKTRLVFTERNHTRFWYWYIENLWQQCRVSDRHHFPTVAALKKEKSDFDESMAESLPLGMVNSRFIQAHADNVVLYVIPVPDVDKVWIVATPAVLGTMIDVACNKLRMYVDGGPLLSILARIMGTVVSSIQKSLGTDQSVFWNTFAEAIVTHREDLLVRQANLSTEFFRAAAIIEAYTRNEIKEQKKRQENDAEKGKAMQGILHHVSGAGGFLVSQAEFNAQFKPYQKRWPDLKESFLERFMRPSKRSKLPEVVKLVNSFVYRDHVYPVFRAHLSNMSKSLREYYVNSLKSVLHGSRQGSAFAGTESFREDIRSRIANDDPILLALLSRPRLVSEGIVHYVAKVRKTPEAAQIKEVLSRYFENEKIRFKPPEVLLNLLPNDLLDQAYKQLNILYRFFIRFLGRYESYRQVFGRAQRNTDGGEGGAVRNLSGDRPSSAVTDGTLRSDSEETTVRRRDQARPRGRSHSLSQQDRAWEEFHTAYKKKKNH